MIIRNLLERFFPARKPEKNAWTSGKERRSGKDRREHPPTRRRDRRAG